MTTPPFTNRLIDEKSPYLLQHAHNPVDWFPWGQEAFDLAQKLDKPIFLSIGYATCHWCHVMERESFENPEIAKMLNEAFVNIKVDREELPQVDAIYMEFAQALLSSSGGWPLNLVLTPQLKPFFAVTYLPPTSRHQMPGMGQFIEHIQKLWSQEDKEQLIAQADKIFEVFEKASLSSGDQLPTEQHIEQAVQVLYQLIDPIHGGFKGEPKFPMGYQSVFLLEYAKLLRDSRALFCVELTLDKMHQGGVYDQLGGGFSRYAVDDQWVIPHFEKMLYDNALLARAYLDAWKYTQKPSYLQVCEETLSYVLSEMTHPLGGFYSAEDADTQGHEGAYYTWSYREIRELLSDEEMAIVSHYYDISLEGNFEGKNVLRIARPLQELLTPHQQSIQELEGLLASARAKLVKKRELREHPFKDDKILVSWNGLMINAMIQTAQTRFKEAAIKAAEFIEKHLFQEGKLLRRYRDGQARFAACLDDYAFLIQGLLSLFEEGCGTKWLKWALELAEILERDFKVEGGAYYYSPEDPTLLLRKCDFYDGAEPSGNAVHCENLLRLYQITQDSKYLSSAEDLLKAAKKEMETYPPGACYHLSVLMRYLDKRAPLLVIALDEEQSLRKEIQGRLNSSFHPHLTVVWKESNDSILLNLIPSLVDKKPMDGQTAVYICRQEHCESPLFDRAEILKALETL